MERRTDHSAVTNHHEGLEAWLRLVGLEALAPQLIEEDVDLAVLRELDEADLKELGLTLGQRRRLLKALHEEMPAAPDESAGPSADGAAERRQITVMFVDLVGSTELAARLDPEDMAAVIRAFQNTVSGEIARFGGHVAKFMGDGVLAYFGWPRVREDEVEMALRAGLAVIAAAARLASPGDVPLAIRVGCASGPVVVGDLIGDNEARERTVVGDTPNLAARLQAIASAGALVISGTTRQLAGEHFEVAPLPALTLRGYDRPVEAFRVLRENMLASRFEAREGQRVLPLCGRAMELSLLLERWELARGGEGQCVLLTGEAGIGKSRITAELLRRLEGTDHFRIRQQCSPYYADTPLWPVIQQLRRAAGLDPDAGNAENLDRLTALLAKSDGDAHGALSALADAVGLVPLDAESFERVGPQQRRMITLQALAAQPVGLARKRPVLMVLEDAHWADPSTLELFGLVLDAIGDQPVMILMTSRPDGEPRLAAHPHVTHLALNRLSRAAAQQLIEELIGETSASSEMLEQIIARTDGVPLFVEELTKAVVEARDHDASPGAIPVSLHDSLLARLDRLPGVREVAQIAACIGREFDYALLVAVADLPKAQIDEALDRLVEAQLAFRRGAAPAVHHVFKHALVRDAAYASLLHSRRRTIHGAIAAALAARPDGAPDSLIAYHAAEAGDLPQAIERFVAAGRAAAHRSANEEAVSTISNALGLCERLPEGPARAVRELDARVALSVPLIAVRGYASPEVEAALTPAVALAEQLKDDSCRFTVLRALWNCIYDQGELTRSAALADQLVALAETSGRGDWQRLAQRALGSNRKAEGRLPEARAAFEAVLSDPTPWSPEQTLFEHGESPELIARLYLGWMDTIEGMPDTGLARIEAAVRDADALELPIASVFAGAIHSLMLFLRRDVEGCLAHAEKNLRLSEKHGFVFWTAHDNVFIGWAKTMLGGGASTLQQSRRGIEQWKATGARLHVATWDAVAADAALHLGCMQDATELIEEAFACIAHAGEEMMLAEILRLHGGRLLRDGDVAAAEDALRCACATASRQGVHWFALRAVRDLAAFRMARGDEPQESAAALEEALDAIAEGDGLPDLVEAREMLNQLRA
ncbi:AAA family ATPase [Aurantimonas sp. C2-6-R+9]|uniref:adenylate/guanylate cyclase domain-containing protein n=1 Tax=unclassified Aurantimonas TaxID=2638230 RepID=UPI002E187545|nr:MULTISPECIES: AAA family ATPase [unclassified Aurantimonas]MEC5383382.1 AAA family ATPase [Aurantimonas sp. C2-6-R+9]MEC5414321.1 AAA family ATPase [Aurantimonas sp. C2-4-R8]